MSAKQKGIARLDAYFDPNERKYYISSQSVKLSIAEEKAKAAKINSEFSEPVRNDSTDFGNGHKETASEKRPAFEADREKVKSLENEVMDLKIVNRGKDFFINQLKSERDNFVTQLLSFSRTIGELETKLLQIEGPTESARKLTVRSGSETENNEAIFHET
ncbi:MAG: hypothetical protein ABI042_18305 [Verrucomicrobiota bacterium]